MATRDSMYQAGAAVLAGLLTERGDHPLRVTCECGAEAHYHDHRRKQLLTAQGPVELNRTYYVCPQCHLGQSPRDRELDVAGTRFSPAVRRMMATVDSESSFDQGREQLELPEVCAPAAPIFYIEMDGTGVPVVKAETEGRAGKVNGQPSHTREVKLGCVFTQTTTNEDGRPVRDQESTTYVAAIETAEQFGLRLFTEAWRRGWSRAIKKVLLGDGAVWIWNLADQHFPGAIQIVDLYHARQHLWELSAKLFPGDDKARQRWTARCLDRLEHGKIEALVKILRSVQPATEELATASGGPFHEPGCPAVAAASAGA